MMKLCILFFSMCCSLISLGCATLINGEVDDALPQGKNTLSIGVGAAVPSLHNSPNDTIATKNGITIIDKRIHWGGVFNSRYGLTENTDVTTSLLFTTYPGYGLGVTLKRAFSVFSLIKTAIYGNAQYFFTHNEVPYYEYAQATYNRKFSSFYLGGVGSITLPRAKGSNPLTIFSFGAKLSANYADVHRDFSNIQYDYFDPNVDWIPERVTSYYYSVIPYITLSVRSPKQVFCLEIQRPYLLYNNFKSASVGYWQVSIGTMFQLFKFGKK